MSIFVLFLPIMSIFIYLVIKVTDGHLLGNSSLPQVLFVSVPMFHLVVLGWNLGSEFTVPDHFLLLNAFYLLKREKPKIFRTKRDSLLKDSLITNGTYHVQPLKTYILVELLAAGDQLLLEGRHLYLSIP